MTRPAVAAVIVTYNRKALLLECLEAVFGQTCPVSKVILIDNASTDGTVDALREKGYLDDPRMDLRQMSENTGGAGGFYEGLRIVRESEADWAWIMDDDPVPSPNCLETLLESLQILQKERKDGGETSFLASSVFGENGEYMNVPTVSSQTADNGYMTWYSFLHRGMVELDHATFVSLLINRKALEKCGLPCREFFLWGDDSEFTTRLTHYFGKAYMVGNSVAVHKRKNAVSLAYDFETDPKRIAMRHYIFRNISVIDRYYHKNGTLMTFLHLVKEVLAYPAKIFDKLKRKRQSAKIRGYFEGLTDYRRFKKYIDGQLGK